MAAVWLAALAASAASGEVMDAEVVRALGAVEERALAWTVSPDASHRAVGARVLAVLASPRWPDARGRLVADDEPQVMAALLDGISWMGDDAPEAVDFVWCRLSETADVNRSWPVVNALAGLGRPVPFDRLARTIPPLRDQGTRQVYRNLRRLLVDMDPALLRIIEEEALAAALEEIGSSSNDDGTKAILFAERHERARRTLAGFAGSAEDREPLRDLVETGDEDERDGALVRLLELQDAGAIRAFDEMARHGDFFSCTNSSGRATPIIDWPSVASLLSTAALERLLWELRIDGRFPWGVDQLLAELRARGALPDRTTILVRTRGLPDELLARTKLGYLTADAELVGAALEEGLVAMPPEKVISELLMPLENTVRAMPGSVLAMAPVARHRVFAACWRVWELEQTRWRSKTGSLYTRDAAASAASAPLFLAGVFSAGGDLDVMWSAWLAEKEDPLRRLVLGGVVSSADPRAATLRHRLEHGGTVDMRSLVAGAPAFESVMAREVGSALPASFHPRSTPADAEVLPPLGMLPLLGPWIGATPESAACADLAREVPSWATKSLLYATRQQIAEVLLSRAGVERDAAVRDRRRTVRHVGWLMEMDRSAASVQFSSVVEPSAGMADLSGRWLALLRAQPDARHVVAAPLSGDMASALDEVLDPDGNDSEVRRKVEELVNVMRVERDRGTSCGAGYREPERVEDVWDPGFSRLGLAAARHLGRHLEEPETRVRHAVAALLWKVFLDDAGPELLLADARLADAKVRESALRHLALLVRRDAAALFVEALDSPEPGIRAAGLAGVERLRLRRAIPKVETMVLDRDLLVSRIACAVLRHFNGPESWRVLVPLLDLPDGDQRRWAGLSALYGFRRIEVVRAIAERLVELGWQGDLALASLTGGWRFPTPLSVEKDRAACARQWLAWAERNERVPPDEWLREGIAMLVAEIGRSTDHDERETLLRRLTMLVGPNAVPRKPDDVGSWWEKARGMTYRDLVWSGFGPVAGDGCPYDYAGLLPDMVPELAAGALATCLPRLHDSGAGQVHRVLVSIAGVDHGNPATVTPELRARVLERWRAWELEKR